MSEINNTANLDSLKKLKGASGKNIKKTKSKMIGVKSAFVTPQGVAVSSFAEVKNDRGEKVPNIELITSRDGSETFRETLRLFRSASVCPDAVNLVGALGEVELENPALRLSRGDYVGIKSAMERKYFGREFPDDNIHIQIAYNIADIKKHLMRFINQIIYVFYNINRTTITYDSYNDLIGTVYTFADLDRQRVDSSNASAVTRAEERQLLLDGVYFYDAYFPGVFRLPRKDSRLDSEAEKLKCDRHNFNILRLLSAIRQACEHEKLGSASAEALLYDLRAALRGESDDLLRLLDNLYKKVPDLINREFSGTPRAAGSSANNLYILSRIFPDMPREQLLEKYYRYTVIKEHSIIGVNLKLLREIIIRQFMPEISDRKYHTGRGKLYTVLGFMLAEWLVDSEYVADTVCALRANSTEEGRVSIYLGLAEAVWSEYADSLRRALEVFNREMYNKFKGKPDFSIDVTDKPYALDGSQGLYFSKLVLLMTKFLDGKEINELLTGLISRFENIQDLLYSASECGVHVRFADGYSMFADAGRAAAELRLVKNIARMKPEAKNFKNCMLIDAVNILGINESVLDAEECTDEDLKATNAAFLKRIHGEGDRANHQVRNFLINNVIKSRWFFYIARYTKPSQCREIIKSEKLVAFVLREIPDDQIKRYYKSITGYDTEDLSRARAELKKRLVGFSVNRLLDTVENMPKGAYRDTRENSEKQKNKAIIGLYLTVIYLAIKSVVKVNSVFSIAFSCLERDLSLKGYQADARLAITEEMLMQDKQKVDGYTALRNSIRDNEALTKDGKRVEYKALKPILKEMHYDLHSYHCVKANYENAISLRCGDADLIIAMYRNAVAHLNIPVRFADYLSDMKEITSYYSIFVYALERYIVDSQIRNTEGRAQVFAALIRRFADTLRRGIPSRDMLWIINTPFAYNLARYKNLSVEDLFYGRCDRQKQEGVSGSAPV